MENKEEQHAKHQHSANKSIKVKKDVQREDTKDLDIDESSGGSGSTATGLKTFGDKIDMDQEDKPENN